MILARRQAPAVCFASHGFHYAIVPAAHKRSLSLSGACRVVCAADSKGSKRRQKRARPRGVGGGRSRFSKEGSEIVPDASAIQDDQDGLREVLLPRKERKKPRKQQNSIKDVFGEGRTLDLLSKAAWAGLFSLVATFLLTHLVIVGDWVGKTPPAAK